jgi:hypothetical protein
MGWQTQVFGKENPGNARIAWSLLSLVAMGLVIHGMYTRWVVGTFLPAPVFYGTAMYAACGTLGAVLAGLAFWKLPPSASLERHSLRHFLVVLFMAPLVAMFAWFVVAGSLASIWTGAFGSLHDERLSMRTEYSYQRRSCDYTARGVHVDGWHRDKLCIPEALYEAYPDQDVRVRILGRRSALGFVIDSFEVADDRR